jgi:hypothetical protein
MDPWKNIGLPSSEVFFDLSYFSSVPDVPTFETKVFPQKLYTWIVLYLTFS